MNQYHIYEKIGRGKHSVVYKGRKKKTIQYYAIKSVEKSQKSRVLQEVRTMHALDHRNILRFYAWYETTNHLWLILEYCVGGDLMTLLKTDCKLPESSIHDFARDLVIAMQYLHHNSIIYCDLKPSNVLLDENGRLKLGGFGLSRRLSDINKSSVSALPPAKRGTPCYMAPELFQDGATHSTASDLWSLGCVLYECATGRSAFLGDTFQDVVHDILNRDPDPVQGASPEFAHLLQRLLDKNPATRASWQELTQHPFWQLTIPQLEMPSEPALEAFIAKYNLAPSGEEVHASQASERARDLRQSVNVTRLSRIALTNIERQGEANDYTAAQAHGANIRIESADAELDFEEVKEEAGDEEEPSAPLSSQDDTAIDQTTAALMQEAAMISRGSTGSPVAGSAHRRMDAAQEAGSSVAAAPTSNGTSHSIPGYAALPPGTGAGAAALGEVEQEDMSSSLPRTGVPLANLIWHASDTAVKPIAGNRKIERLPEPHYEQRELPFQPLSLTEMLNTNQRDLETFLTDIYRALASSQPIKEKTNVLCYFETLCTDTNAANILINSSLTVLFIRMLRNAKASPLRVKLASVLGLMVRHTTYITDELAGTGVVDVLAEALRDKSERVRRRAMATLGELLFYIATQQQEPGGASVQEVCTAWGITTNTLSLVRSLLKPAEDEIAQHYAVKTIENIASQGGQWAAKFANQDVIYSLVQIYNTSKSENLKATTASTLSRLVRSSPPLVTFLIDKFGVRLITNGLADSSSKVQVASVNMLNLALSQPELSSRQRSAFTEERGLAGALLGLMDHQLALLKAKAVIGVLLLCRQSTRWLLEACKIKLVAAIEKLARERDPYVGEALAALQQELAALVASLCAHISEELGSRASARKPGTAGSASKPAFATRSYLGQFQVVLPLVASSYFRAAVVTSPFIADLAAYHTATSSQGSNTAALTEFRSILTQVLEAFCQQGELVAAHPGPVLESLLPALCQVVLSASEGAEIRFLSLRMISDVLHHLLYDQQLYGSVGPAGVRSGGSASAAIDAFLQQHLLPVVPQLLVEEDPMPLYALKFLGGLLEVNTRYVRDIEAMGLAPRFFEFLSLEHANNNVHNIRLCRQIIAAGAMSSTPLQKMQVAERVAAVVVYAHENNVEPFLEPVLELSAAIIARDSADLRAGRSEGALLHTFVEQLPVYLDLCMHCTDTVALAAAGCVSSLVMMFPNDSLQWLLSSEGAATLAAALSGQNLAAGKQPPAQMLASLLAAVNSAMRTGRVVPPASVEFNVLVEVIEGLLRAADPLVKQAAKESYELLAGYVSL